MKGTGIRPGSCRAVQGLLIAIVVLCACAANGGLFASGLSFTNPRLDSTDFGRVTFTVSWQNAWNLDANGGPQPGNHDAVWVFLKYSLGLEWHHLDLSSQDLHLSADPSRLEVRTVPDHKGAFLVPAFSGAGDIESVDVTLEFARTFAENDQVYFLAAGIEMVHVPGGAFQLGDAASNSSFWAGDSSGPCLVESEAAIAFGTGAQDLARDSVSASATSVPAAWPKGTEGFYCMKYELSQEQYRDFLNSLALDQQAARIAASPQSSPGTIAMSTGLPARNGISVSYAGSIHGSSAGFAHDLQQDGSFDGENDGQNRACNWLSWDDLCAYLDWACLRPLTEFEFEKACRGPLPPLPLEFAWGTDEVLDANTLLADGTAEEGVAEVASGNQGLASHGYAGPQGPLRCGFAAGASTDRRQAGSSYYGIMELSGNLWEQCVVASPAGLGFQPETGDGELDAAGFANVASWPGASGAGHRGGGWNSGILTGFRDLAVSDRFYAGLPPTSRRNTVGGRGGRQ